MSAAILDRARAFAAIAEFLEESDRKAIAKAIGDRIKQECPPVSAASGPTREVAEVEPDPERAKYDETAKFLADHGYSSAEMVRAAGRLEEFLKKSPHLTREAGMRVWLGIERGTER